MKIAIYHNLNPGGALFQLRQFIKNTSSTNEITVYSVNKNLEKVGNIKHKYFPLKKSTNFIDQMFQDVFELRKINKHIAEDINSSKFKAVYVFPCQNTQCPDIVKYLKNKNYVYVFAEPKREFYEQTSYDHFTFKRWLARMLRIYLKYNDYVNTRLARNIIVNSYFSYSNLKKIYNKKGIVIYPGLVKKKPTKINIYNKDKIIIVGQLSYTKGYDHALKLIAQSGNKIVTVIGRKTEDYKNIVKISKHYGVTINLVTTDNDYIKNKLYKKHGIFIACQRNEPFGITTAEACYNNLVVFGLNKGGTSEIVSHGLNGFLYEENSLKTASECLKKFQSQRRPTITKINSIDWKQMSNKMISIFNE